MVIPPGCIILILMVMLDSTYWFSDKCTFWGKTILSFFTFAPNYLKILGAMIRVGSMIIWSNPIQIIQ